MTKMNRREYLALMGASAGVAIGASCSRQPASNAGSSVPDAATTQATKAEAPRIWNERWPGAFPKDADYPPSQTIKLAFYGLGSLSPGDGGTCEVGFHNSGDEHHRHELSIFAYKLGPGGACTSIYDSTKPKEQIALIDLKVEEPDNRVAKAFFYQPGDVQRRTDLSDPLDFRWIVDFESEYLYRNFPGFPHPEKLPRVSHIYRPKFTVPSGLFYTLRKTLSTFEARSIGGNLASRLGNVADVIGANIYVKQGKGLTLTVNTKEHVVKAPGEVYFINKCTMNSSGNLCKPDPESPDRKLRGDFYLHYKAFELEGKPEYELVLVGRPLASEIKQAKVECNPTDIPYDLISDESPCAAAGYSSGP